MTDQKLVFHTPSTIMEDQKVRHTMNFETLAIWKALTRESIYNCKREEEDTLFKGYDIEEIKDMLETQIHRIKIAQGELEKFNSRSSRRAVVQDATAPMRVNYDIKGEEWDRLISLETNKDAIIRRRNLQSVVPRGDIIINGGTFIYDIISRNGRRDIFTNFIIKESDEEYLVNKIMSRIIKYSLKEEQPKLRKYFFKYEEMIRRYWLQLFPILLETMTEQYTRTGFRIVKLFHILHIIVGHLVNIIPSMDRSTLDPKIYTAPKMWMTNFLIEMEKVNTNKFFSSKITKTSTKLSAVIRQGLQLENESNILGLDRRSRMIGKLHLVDACRQCFDATRFKCGKCRETRYCSKICQEKDWIHGHKEECGKEE